MRVDVLCFDTVLFKLVAREAQVVVSLSITPHSRNSLTILLLLLWLASTVQSHMLLHYPSQLITTQDHFN